MIYSVKSNKKVLEDVKKNGKMNEVYACKWLKERRFKIIYWHEGKANNKPYDIICSKKKKYYVLDVKSGKRPQISLTSLQTLLNKKIDEYREEIENYTDLKRIDMVGYIFVFDKKCLIFYFPKKSYDAYKARDTIRKNK